MKKILSTLIIIIFLFSILLIAVLATLGIETDRFNKTISQKIYQSNNKIKIELKTIKYKLDIKQISLFLETENPKIFYKNNLLPAKKIKVYIDFTSAMKSEAIIKKINFASDKININQLKKISASLKPSNFSSFLNNNIKTAELTTDVDIYFNNQNLFDNFIAKGSVTNLKGKIFKDINLENTNFTFLADKSDILIKNLFSNSEEFIIEDGDLKINLTPDILIESNFRSKLKLRENTGNYTKLLKNFEYLKNLAYLDVQLENNFLVSFDKTYKLKKFDFKSNGKILKANFNFKNSIEYNFLDEKINKLTIINSDIKTNVSSKDNLVNISGQFFLNEEKPQKFNITSNTNAKLVNLKANIDLSSLIKINLINFVKTKGDIVNININLTKTDNKIYFKEIRGIDKNNLIQIKGLKIKNKSLLDLENILIKTNKDGKKNNDFLLTYGKNIMVKGTQFDATNLVKIFNQKEKKNYLSNVNKEIEIVLSNVIIPLSENLKNFRLIGKINKGKFSKISSKGNFTENNFLDISMKNNNKTKKKYLDIYSDVSGPLLAEFSFFKGLSGGKLHYTSVFDEKISTSKLKIKNFKVINAPGMVKLLSLADLGGLADLAEGEGLSFDLLEINMENSDKILKLNEILAIGPSISVMMEGYQDNSVTSLRGTLVPAKTLNILISKIPVIGNIVIPKDVGEGLFGISFKMKGPPHDIKTTINPIRTITPRFIQKIIEKKKY